MRDGHLAWHVRRKLGYLYFILERLAGFEPSLCFQLPVDTDPSRQEMMAQITGPLLSRRKL